MGVKAPAFRSKTGTRRWRWMARWIIIRQLRFGSGYLGNAERLHPGEVQREHGRAAVGFPIRELELEQAFGLHPSSDYC